VTTRTPAAARDRLAGLPVASRLALQRAAADIARGAHADAATPLIGVLATTPSHPEALRLLALVRYRAGAHREAIELLRRALAGWPDDAPTLSVLGGLLGNLGETDEAVALLQRACAADPNLAAAWYNLGRLLGARADTADAADALRRAVAIAPDHVPARVLLGGTLVYLGDARGAADEYRRAIDVDARAVRAWLGLANLKTVLFDAADVAALEALVASPALRDDDRAIACFALGKAYDDVQRSTDAFATYVAANAAIRRTTPWDARAFSRETDAIRDAFASIAPHDARDAAFGEEVIFIVGLARSGSTLVEQMLAAHADVEGASELPDLEAVIAIETKRRGRPFADWARDASPAEWHTLGERYLERTRRWRTRRRFTDKMTDNWRLAGAALAMLPGARIVNCRRDAVETCWSCFTQLFGPGRQRQSYDLADLAAHWHDYDRLARHWRALAPDRFVDVDHETLTAEPERTVRALLDFCALPFDAACLRFHEAARPVRTLSAAQVREPLRRDTARTARYGTLLDPLRRALASGAE
jgi:tetratricopeptide (TPR) repeat protein